MIAPRSFCRDNPHGLRLPGAEALSRLASGTGRLPGIAGKLATESERRGQGKPTGAARHPQGLALTGLKRKAHSRHEDWPVPRLCPPSKGQGWPVARRDRASRDSTEAASASAWHRGRLRDQGWETTRLAEPGARGRMPKPSRHAGSRLAERSLPGMASGANHGGIGWLAWAGMPTQHRQGCVRRGMEAGRPGAGTARQRAARDGERRARQPGPAWRSQAGRRQ